MFKNLKIIFSQEAEIEFFEYYLYYENELEGLSDRFVVEVEMY